MNHVNRTVHEHEFYKRFKSAITVLILLYAFP